MSAAALDKLSGIFSKPLYALIICLIAGGVSALAMAPYNMWGVLFIALPVLYFAILNASRKRSAFFRGWAFGFGYFAFSLYWIGNALLVEGNPYTWAWPLAVTVLPAGLALFTALAMLAAKGFLNLRSVWGWVGFASIFTGFEWLRGHLFTGFPWNLFGYTWADMPEILQILNMGDVYILTLLTLFWACAPACFLLSAKRQRNGVFVFAALSFAAVHMFGATQLNSETEFRDDVIIKMVQPNIAQEDKWAREKIAENFQTHIDLSRFDGSDPETPRVIIWPETAMSYRMIEDPQGLTAIRNVLSTQPEGSVLLTGLLRYDRDTEEYGNSLVMIDQNGGIGNIYNKSHLVPFGEYIPFQKWIPLKPVAQFQGFARGNGPQNYTLPNSLNYGALVCYEVLFPGRTIARGISTPDFVVNITNDAWYGISPGPHQHFTQALFRSVETGIPIIRVANTGFSAVISPRGEVFEKTNLFARDSRNFRLPIKKGASVSHALPKSVITIIIMLFLNTIVIVRYFANTRHD